MIITKEIEIELSELSTMDLVDELTDRVCSTDILLNEEGKKALAPRIEELVKNLTEILDFIRHPHILEH